jgi:acyl carrier protein phosphodiesterase
MNLLGHAFLSFEDPDILCGNMMGDFVKGRKKLETFPEKIKAGLILHRKIDTFTDHHPAVIKAKNIFRPDYRLYSGPIIDVIFDHYLANDPKYFHNEKALSGFTTKVYQQLTTNREYQPENFQKLYHFLEDEKVLYKYRTINGLKTALNRLSRRMLYAASDESAIHNTMRYYYELNQYYFDFMDDMLNYAKKELSH